MGEAREAVVRMWAAFREGDPAKIRAAMTPDATWIAPPGNATAIASGATAEQVSTVDGIIAFLTGPYRKLFPQGVQVETLSLIEQGDVVVMETMFRARVVNGRDYANRYCWVIRTRDSRVAEMREYMDTHAGFAQMFGDATPRLLV